MKEQPFAAGVDPASAAQDDCVDEVMVWVNNNIPPSDANLSVQDPVLALKLDETDLTFAQSFSQSPSDV